MHLAIHHIRYAVKDINTFSRLLMNHLGFASYAKRTDLPHSTLGTTQVLNHNGVIFIIDQRLDNSETDDPQQFCAGNAVYSADTVCDVCLQCDDIPKVLHCCEIHQTTILQPLTKVETDEGPVLYAVVKSPVGNLQHTLIDVSQYTGQFLPGFKTCEQNCTVSYVQPLKLIETVDHIALAVDIGDTDTVIRWYDECFGFHRLIINVDEDLSEGFVVKEGYQGLRLKAAITGYDMKQTEYDMTRLVFCESLGNSAENSQISYFLRQHGGAGVQHIAFGTQDIVKALSHFQGAGLDCVPPPDSYYNEVTKSSEITTLNFDVATLKKHKILLESHRASPVATPELTRNTVSWDAVKLENQIEHMNKTNWFIMQAFTRPVFKEKTLFFEVIQRRQTLAGFGAGNIGALWRAVQRDLLTCPATKS